MILRPLVTILFWLSLSIPPAICAAALPDFDSDQQTDLWLRDKLSSYRRMASVVDRCGGYTFGRVVEHPGGLAYFKEGRGHIEFNDRLKGPHRVSILMFELTNLYQEPLHREVADRVRRGDLNSPSVFGLLREIIEYDGLRLHRDMLLELKKVIDVVPAEMFTWASSTAKCLDDYQQPYAFNYLKAQEASGHTAHYIRLFDQHRAEYLKTMPKEEEKGMILPEK